MSDSSIITQVEGKAAMRFANITGATSLGNLASYLVSVDGKTCVAVAIIGGNKIQYKDVPGTSYTVLESDLGKTIYMNSVSDSTVTIPDGLPDGFWVNIRNATDKTITYSAGGSAVLDPINQGSLQETQGTTVIVEHKSGDIIYLEGRLTSP